MRLPGFRESLSTVLGPTKKEKVATLIAGGGLSLWIYDRAQRSGSDGWNYLIHHGETNNSPKAEQPTDIELPPTPEQQ